ERYQGQEVDPESMRAEDTLFLMYTSGTTGRPKGAQHSIGGYLSYVAGTSKYYQDIHPEDTYWCFADIGWITGHSYIVYGPLALGTTSVMYEGVPTYPDAGRPWRIAERLGVNIFHTAPTTIRMLRKLGPDEPAKYNYRFKHMTTVGEPIEPEVWRWYHDVVGKDEAVIVDTWWQTENGGFLGSTLPALQPMKPGSCGPGVLGIYPVIYDEDRNEVEAGSGRAAGRAARQGRRDVRRAQARSQRKHRDRGESGEGDRDRDRQDRTPEERLDRAGHAEDALRQDHAQGDRRNLELHRCRRRIDVGEPRDCRRDPRAGSEGEGGPRRGSARALTARDGGDQGVRPGRIAGNDTRCEARTGPPKAGGSPPP